ncbi:hypothetical protein PMAYCL1PPCAC_26604, partial [Pristionchus mayeri]
GDSQVSTKKNGESAKVLPKGGRGAPRKYSRSSNTNTASKKKRNITFVNVSDESEDEPSRTGSKRPKVKKR